MMIQIHENNFRIAGNFGGDSMVHFHHKEPLMWSFDVFSAGISVDKLLVDGNLRRYDTHVTAV